MTSWVIEDRNTIRFWLKTDKDPYTKKGGGYRGHHMFDKDEILENIRSNEEIANRFFEIEVSILSTYHFKDLFEQLVSSIQ